MSEPAFDIHQLQDMDYVEEKWQQWSDENKSTKFDAVSEEELKENIIKDLSFVSQKGQYLAILCIINYRIVVYFL